VEALKLGAGSSIARIAFLRDFVRQNMDMDFRKLLVRDFVRGQISRTNI
jgi:hypothetical protein